MMRALQYCPEPRLSAHLDSAQSEKLTYIIFVATYCTVYTVHISQFNVANSVIYRIQHNNSNRDVDPKI